jgi:hypothetical protein
MPKRKRARPPAPPKQRRTKAGPKSTGRPKRKGPRTLRDPSDAPDADVRFVQPYEATKPYLCPGCGNEIPEGLGHVVAVPRSAPDLRRHWHRACWVSR